MKEFEKRLTNRAIQGYAFSNTDQSVIVENNPGREKLKKETIETFSPLAEEIHEAIVSTNRRPITCDFVNSTAFGSSNSRYSVLEFLEYALPMLRNLTHIDTTHLKRITDLKKQFEEELSESDTEKRFEEELLETDSQATLFTF